MSSADVAAVSVVVMTVVLLGGRMMVRRTRGDSFSRAETVTAIGLIAISFSVIALLRTESLIFLLPVVLLLLGIVMVSTERNRTMGRLAAISAYGAVAIGVITIVIAVARAVGGA
jgi:hypothetical protein